MSSRAHVLFSIYQPTEMVRGICNRKGILQLAFQRQSTLMNN